MNAIEKAAASAPAASGLALLRQPVPEHLISPLPKGTKAQNECPAHEKVTCKVCGGWHHPKVRHLDYVGHAAATHLLLDADPKWDWRPLAYDADGLPKFDDSGGLWIKLTVCGVSRLGYGHADRKAHMDAGAREKEVIGDALRNAGMRFGLALELWSKADIHASADTERDQWVGDWIAKINSAANVGALKAATSAALAEAEARKDQEAADAFLAANVEKMARAKRTSEPATKGRVPALQKRPDEADLSDDDIPH